MTAREWMSSGRRRARALLPGARGRLAALLRGPGGSDAAPAAVGRWPLSLLVALAATLALLVTWGGVSAILGAKWDDAVQAQLRQNDNLAISLQEQPARVIAAADQALQRLGGAVRDGSFEPADFVRIANETGLVPRILIQLSLVGPDGRFAGSNIAPGGGRGGGADLGEREHIRVHLRPEGLPQASMGPRHDGLFIGKPVLGKVSGRWSIQLSRRIDAADGRVLGVVVASLDPAYFEDVYRGVKLGSQGTIALVGTDLVVRARVLGGASHQPGGVVPEGSVLARQLPLRVDAGHHIGPSDADGVERIVAFRRVGELPLYVVVGTSTAQALQAWHVTRVVMLGLTALLSATILGAAGMFLYGVRRLERQNRLLRLNEARAQAASRAKGAFLANMSHEIRTPMNAVLGLAQLLERTSLPPESRELVRRIGVAGRSLLAIINDVLDSSRIESGRMELERAPFRLGGVLDNVTAVMSVAAAGKGLALDVPPPPRDAQWLLGDALRLEQVLVNLTSNAIKFTDRGHVGLSVAVVQESAQQLCLRFSVRDTGIGLSPQQQQLIFMPFAQADASTTRRFGGTGLGLSICRELVGLMGGEIGVRSAPGQGSEFWFTAHFGRAEPAPQGPGHPAAAGTRAGRLQGLRLLVVDDSAINRDVARRILEHEGAEVALAEDGCQALSWLNLHGAGVDLVLMDVQMPVMDGCEAARRIRRMPQLAALPVAALTGGVLEEQREAAAAAGMDAFIPKPFEIDFAVGVILDLAGRARTHTRAGEPRPAADGAGQEPPAPAAREPVLDAARGLAAWGDLATWRKYLHHFAREYGDAAQALAAVPPAEAARRAHRLLGAAAVLGLGEVAAAARAAEAGLLGGQDAGAALQRLRAALSAAQDEIARTPPAPGDGPVPAAVRTPADRPRLDAALAGLAQAWERADPGAIEPWLAELGALLPGEQLAPLRQALDRFDFHEGRRLSRTLARRHGMALDATAG